MSNLKILFIFPLIFANVAWSASFNCEGNLNTIENIICSSEVLGSLDEALIHQYKITKTFIDEQNLKQDQVGWIREKQRACDSEDCLVKEYLTRIHTLRFWNETVDVQTDRLGYYESRHTVPVYNSTRNDWNDMVNVSNTLLLDKISKDGKVNVNIHIVTTNGHSCTLEGRGKIQGSEIIVDKDKSGKSLKNECSLSLKFYEGQIEVVDNEFSCKSVDYCGMRAGFNGWVFTRFDIENY